jgi:hypothetical protein
VRVAVIVVGVIIIAGIMLFIGYLKVWRDFGTDPGYHYIRTYKFSERKFTIEQQIYNLEQQHPEQYVLDSGTRFSKDNWFTLRLNEPGDSIIGIFRFKGDLVQWSRDSSSELMLLSLKGHGKEIHYSSDKNNNLTDTGVLYQVFESRFIDSLRTPVNH